jgi:hypothetical protein
VGRKPAVGVRGTVSQRHARRSSYLITRIIRLEFLGEKRRSRVRAASWSQKANVRVNSVTRPTSIGSQPPAQRAVAASLATSVTAMEAITQPVLVQTTINIDSDGRARRDCFLPHSSRGSRARCTTALGASCSHAYRQSAGFCAMAKPAYF